MADYNPDSIDAVLSRIENTLNTHVENTERYHRHNDDIHEKLGERLSGLEGDKKKIMGIAIGSGVGTAGLAHAITKLFGGGQ